ncbi:hypothetical protein BJ170DRAFT_680675 [Xylariales sp. AK1849]|nr:hypothetical protein BJ170DRAFT_680675 [Xylariales sp. AK1849]
MDYRIMLFIRRYLCDTTDYNCITGDWQQAYAELLVQFVVFYAQENLTVTHLGFLNEPELETRYSQMQISAKAQDAIDFIPVLYNMLRAADLNTSLQCCDAVGRT